jgi:hypothetical protein
MLHIGFTANVYAMDVIEGDAEASAPKRRCKDGLIRSDLELLNSDLAESDCWLPEEERCTDMDLNNYEIVDSSSKISAVSNEAATASNDCRYEPTRTLQIDHTSAFTPRPPKRFPRAFWRGLVHRAVAHSIHSCC